jgi:hypothetical protein
MRLIVSLVCFLQDAAPPAYKEGDAKSDPDETASERAAAAWSELQQWRKLITPAFKHVFSRVAPLSPEARADRAKLWPPESDDEVEDGVEEQKEGDGGEQEEDQATDAHGAQQPVGIEDDEKSGPAAADLAAEDEEMHDRANSDADGNCAIKLVELHSLLLDWPSPPTNDAARQSLRTRTTRVLQLLDDAEVKKSIAEGKDTDKEVRTHALRAQLSSICIDSFSAAQ